MRSLSSFVGVALLALAAAAEGRIAAAEASKHIGEDAVVCGRVASAKHLSTGRKPTFLNLDQPYPNQVFTALIWEPTRALFSFPPESLLGKSICVTGRIQDYKGKAEIIVELPSQIAVQP